MFVKNIQQICVFSLIVHAAFGRVQKDSDTNYVTVPCIEDAECEYVNGTCINNYCKCSNSFNCKLSTQAIVNKLEERCQSTRDCNIAHAICNEKRECSCKKDFLASQNKRKCLRAASGLGGSCEESVQCYTNIPSTGCHENKCVCQQHMHEHNGSCYKNVRLGDPCQLHGECSLTSYTKCLKSKCECTENYVANGLECLLKANSINFTCFEDIQCQFQLSHGAECSSGVCRCKDLFHFKASSNQCVHDILLNENCRSHYECHQPGTGPSRLECVLGVCKCKSPYLEENGYCISSSTSAIFFKSIVLFLVTMFLIE
ncbi:hypothetical protein HHI36_011716 [Cryptolaemus montrouzieri]|uniref:EB domain-containing protein n=1 Tax=Cryptolaemus montrouzieri TaxID=559131 RepID=A0ABD2NCH6_9CUCU